MALAALWLTCAYGGVGSYPARLRRRAHHRLVRPTAGTVDPDSIRTPGLDHYETIEYLWPRGPVSRCMPQLISMIADQHGMAVLDAWPTPPPFPVLSKMHTVAGLSGDDSFSTWDSLLSDVGRQFRYFRASEDHPEVKYKPPVKTPEWNAVVWGEGDRFPLGALGLPVGFKKTISVNAWRGDEEQRRASTLWLRPVGPRVKCVFYRSLSSTNSFPARTRPASNSEAEASPHPPCHGGRRTGDRGHLDNSSGQTRMGMVPRQLPPHP